MPRLQPEQILGTLEQHAVRYVIIGGLGATLHGSPLVTHDADICPAQDSKNLERLAAALRDMGARIRTADSSEGVPFACDSTFLRQMKMVNLKTRFGDLDLSFEPAGTGGYDDLEPRSTRSDLGDGLIVRLASLEDIIRSKEAANRDKDRLALPTLRLLLQKIKERQGSSGS